MDLTKLRKAPWSAALLAVAFALAARTPAAAPSSITAKDPPPIPPSVARPDSPDETPRLDAEARAPAVDVRIAPSSRGAIGAWLAAG
ncbi:MAG TPA: hypothetical protein VIF62_05250, partial [Labilithrix sp.]